MKKHRHKHKILYRNNHVNYEAFLERLDDMTIEEAILKPQSEQKEKYRNYIDNSKGRIYKKHVEKHGEYAASYNAILRRINIGRPIERVINTPNTGYGSIYRGIHSGTKMKFKQK